MNIDVTNIFYFLVQPN